MHLRMPVGNKHTVEILTVEEEDNYAKEYYKE